MTEATANPTGGEPEMRLGMAASRLIGAGLVLAFLGLGTGLYLGLVGVESRRSFFHAYLTAYTFFLSITLGALFFVMLQHLTRAGWSVTVRRAAEVVSGNLGLMLLLTVPVLLGLGELYEWAHSSEGEVHSHAEAAHAGPAGEASAAAGHAFSSGKSRYLSAPLFTARFAVYFGVWGLLTWLLRSRSMRQDESGDPGLTTSMERISAPGMIAFSFALIFASIDLLMSQNPHWYSTIFPLYFFSGCVLAALAFLTLGALWVRRYGGLDQTITTEHLHDLGKLLFGFVFFWGYIAFSQYMLIWYANLPEETQFYMARQIGPWIGVSAALLVCQLFLPFLGLLSRHSKRYPAVLAFWCVWLLGARLLDLYWIVMPNLYITEMPAAVGEAAGTPLPEVLRELLAGNQSVYRVAEQHAGFMAQVGLPLEARSIAMLLALALGMGGLYVANTARLLGHAAVVPLGDPRLHESLAFENV